jgi:hypothetical protein
VKKTTPAPIRALFINAGEHSVTEITIPADDTSLSSLQHLVGGPEGCLIDAVYFQHASPLGGHVAFVDDEGLLKGPRFLWHSTFALNKQPLAGNAVIVLAQPDGDNGAATANAAEVEASIEWIVRAAGPGGLDIILHFANAATAHAFRLRYPDALPE